jgi:hypothetical protein
MNIPVYTDKDIKDRKVDYDMSQIYQMPFIERTIFQYANREKCFKEFSAFEETRFTSVRDNVHPKDTLPEARALLGCFAKK